MIILNRQDAMMLFLNREGEMSIEFIIGMAILLVLLIVLLVYLGVFRQSASSLIDTILGFFTGS